MIYIIRILGIVVILGWISLSIYLFRRNTFLKERVKQLKQDRNNLIESRSGWELEMIGNSLNLSQTERKLLFVALDLPVLKKEIKSQGLDDVYEFLKKKIKDSIKD